MWKAILFSWLFALGEYCLQVSQSAAKCRAVLHKGALKAAQGALKGALDAGASQQDRAHRRQDFGGNAARYCRGEMTGSLLCCFPLGPADCFHSAPSWPSS